jgi:hypothetical protein
MSTGAQDIMNNLVAALEKLRRDSQPKVVPLDERERILQEDLRTALNTRLNSALELVQEFARAAKVYDEIANRRQQLADLVMKLEESRSRAE